MQPNKLVAGLVALILLSTGASASAQKECSSDFIAVLDARLERKKDRSRESLNKIFDRLSDLDQSSDKSAKKLVGLLDYYLGEGPATDLEQRIVKRGKSAIPILVEKKNKPLSCLEKYRKLCLENVNDRNDQIDLIIEATKERNKGGNGEM